MLLVFSVTALVRVGTGNGTRRSRSRRPGPGSTRSISGFTGFVSGIILMLFIYWGWDTAVAVNEETKDPAKTPGRAAIISTVMLLVTYVLVIVAAQSFAGVGTKGIGLGNPRQRRRRAVRAGQRGVRHSGFGVPVPAAVLMVLSSAAASTQTTILPTARTTLSMAVYKAHPQGVRQDAPALPHAHGVDDRRWAASRPCSTSR